MEAKQNCSKIDADNEEKNSLVRKHSIESLKAAQIERNNAWIDKMSPVIKYKIQEYVRKQKNRKHQRRKFSIECGMNVKRRARRIENEQEKQKKTRTNRRKTTPPQRLDLTTLEDLE